MGELHRLQSARRRTLRVWATGAAFDKKDVLKARRYQWNGGEDGRPKAWYREVPEADGPAELAWLKANVYGGRAGQWKTEAFGAERRFSSLADSAASPKQPPLF